MPLKNGSKWVEETISSIQSQSYSDWELIVIDDHSTDDSSAIVNRIACTDKRISISINKEVGIISALNQAFKSARGEFMTRMDADDQMPDYRLQLMADTLSNLTDHSIVTGKVKYFSESPISEGYRKYEEWLNQRVVNTDFYKHIFRECIVASPNWMGRTNEFRKYQLFEKLNYPEDYDLCFHWLNNGFQLHSINETTLLWREHLDRTSRNSENYQQEMFFQLKIEWFMRLYPTISSVGVVGAGAKGKLCSKYFYEANFSFNLYDLDYQKFTTPIYNKTVLSADEISDEIVLIARYPSDFSKVQHFIEQQGYEIGKTAFLV